MKGFRFYAEMPNSYASKSETRQHHAFTRASIKHPGRKFNCIAVFLQDDNRPLYQSGDNVEALASVFDYDNSDVCVTGVARDYLAQRCVRIDEATARQLHPRLFARIDA